MPKKYKRGFDQKITYDNMFKAYLNARKSKRYKKDVIKFNLRYEERLLLICKKLKEGKYKFGKFKEFYVYDPKKRRILAAPFEDRIVHTWYVREFIEKIFVPQFISTSYACIKNKGMHRCALDVKKALYNVSKKNKNAYVIKMDVAKFFDNINICARALRSYGVKEKDVVTICLPNMPEAIYAFYACNKIGAIADIIHPLSSPEQINFYLRENKSRFLFLVDFNYAKCKDAIATTLVYKTILVSPKLSMPLSLSIG